MASIFLPCVPLEREILSRQLRARYASPRALVLSAQPFKLLRVEARVEREAHLPEDRLDLVERLLAEVLGLEQLGLGLRHEVGDGPDVRGLEAVGRADGELELLDAAEEVLVPLGPRPRLVAPGRRPLRCRL